MMKAWVIDSYEGISGLKLKEIPIPEPNENQVLVKVASVSLNFRDSAIISGKFQPSYKKGMVPCSDICGYVIKVGTSVKSVNINDRVLSNFYGHWEKMDQPKRDDGEWTCGGPLDGGLQEYMVMDEMTCVPAPSYLNDNDACTIPVSCFTPWYSLVSIGKLKKDQIVLIEGTGNVSLYALQIANSFGAKTIVLTSSREKEEKVKKLGATHVINYKECKDWDKKVMDLTNGEGIDHTVDVVGGENFNKAIRCSKPQGHVYSIGFLSNPLVQVNIYDLIYNRINIHGIAVGPKDELVKMIQQFKSLNIKPIIDSVFSFDEALNAFKRLEQDTFGKIIVEVNKNNISKPAN